MREFTCCFTGHRDIPREDYQEVKHRTEKAVESLMGAIHGAGGALGFDILAAEVVLEKKKIHPEIKLILILPCLDQDRLWSNEDKRVYANIKVRTRSFTLQRNTQKDVHQLHRGWNQETSLETWFRLLMPYKSPQT